MKLTRKNYPSDVSDEEWSFCVPYLTLMNETAPQREYPLREIFNGLRWLVRAGCTWRLMPNDLPPWSAIYQQTQRWIKAGCFEAMANDLRAILRMVQERNPQPSAVILDSRTLQSTPESGARAGFDGHKKRKGSKVHIAVDTLVLFGINNMTYYIAIISWAGNIVARFNAHIMPRISPYEIVLSESEKADLEAAARRYTSSYFNVVRAKVILMAAQGLRNDQIATRVSLPRQIVSKWRKRFFEERLQGLENLARCGRPPSFSP